MVNLTDRTRIWALAFIMASFSTTQDSTAQSEQVIDKRIVPGTRWIANTTVDRGEFVSCQIELVTNHAELRLAFGSEGSLVILLRDPYLEAQVSDVLGWNEGESYHAVLFLDDKSFKIPAHRIWKHTLLVPLAELDRSTIFQSKRIALNVGGIAMRGYEIDGLDAASGELMACRQEYISK